MENVGGYASVEDYLSEFRDMLAPQLPEEYPGSSSVRKLVGEYVGRDKRSLLIFIKTGPETVLSVRYKLPISAKAARVFGLPEELVAHEAPVFGMVAPAEIDGRVAAAQMRSWDAEVTRITHIKEDAEQAAGLRRAAGNILVYWQRMRNLLRNVYDELGILPQHVETAGRFSTLSGPASSPRPLARSSSRTSRSTSDPAAAREWRRRTSSRRRSTRQRGSNIGARRRRLSGKPTSDPTRRRRRTA